MENEANQNEEAQNEQPQAEALEQTEDQTAPEAKTEKAAEKPAAKAAANAPAGKQHKEDLVKYVELLHMKKSLPELNPGDTVKV
ncbi:MAG: hypothetical protein JNK33_06805, partial [Candidatus Doudnabacteria bacterium]|nr:hypothetical protein [Candidatus Doudnabacteria bacterium]